MAEWLKATDCKSVLFRVRRFESAPAHHCGNSSVGRALASQAKCREFESRFPLQVLLTYGQVPCLCSSVVEHSLGKGEVVSSILTTSSKVRDTARLCAGHSVVCRLRNSEGYTRLRSSQAHRVRAKIFRRVEHYFRSTLWVAEPPDWDLWRKSSWRKERLNARSRM